MDDRGRLVGIRNFMKKPFWTEKKKSSGSKANNSWEKRVEQVNGRGASNREFDGCDGEHSEDKKNANGFEEGPTNGHKRELV